MNSQHNLSTAGPAQEYGSRLAAWQRKMEYYEQWHRRLGNGKLLFIVFVVVVGAVLGYTRVAIGLVFLVIIAGIFLAGLVHDRVLKARDMAKRAIAFYQSRLDRLTDRWIGKGSPGTEYLDPHHPYAIDLDIFGAGSLFELMNTAQTQMGRYTFAQWLLHPADPNEISSRQQALDELRPKLDLREELVLLAEDVQSHIRTDAWLAWANEPPILASSTARWITFCLPLITLGALILGLNTGLLIPLLLAVLVQGTWALMYQNRVRRVLRLLESPVPELQWLSRLLGRIEQEPFHTLRLQQLQAGWKQEGITASHCIQGLARLLDWLDSRRNILFAPISIFLLWGTQFAFAIEAWRTRCGPRIQFWLQRLGELEALFSLASFAYEHPADPFPEIITQNSLLLIECKSLGHPLIPESRCVRNDLCLGDPHRLIVISGSNMSGKSTWLRTVGINLVLAMAGAPVRARQLRFTPLQIGASIRTVDSLQEGISRFYAEITRLRQMIQLTEQNRPLLFLLDELLSGTNSHDRRLGATAIVRSLLQRGAIGMITTHDLALTQIANEVQPPGANFHFEDQLEQGKMSFDYRLRSGVVEKSNALALMRSVGLEV